MSSWSAITWDTARAGGLVSYVLLTGAVALGLILRNRWQSSRWPRLVTNELHGYVSLLALVFIVVHVLAVAVDPFTHFGLHAVVVPFATHYRPLWMSLGIVSLYLLLAVWVSSRLRQRIGHRLWRRIHALAFAVYAAATLHGLGTGSDTRTVWAAALYAGQRRPRRHAARRQAARPGGTRLAPPSAGGGCGGRRGPRGSRLVAHGPVRARLVGARGRDDGAGGARRGSVSEPAPRPRVRAVPTARRRARALHGPVLGPADRGAGERSADVSPCASTAP